MSKHSLRFFTSLATAHAFLGWTAGLPVYAQESGQVQNERRPGDYALPDDIKTIEDIQRYFAGSKKDYQTYADIREESARLTGGRYTRVFSPTAVVPAAAIPQIGGSGYATGRAEVRELNAPDRTGGMKEIPQAPTGVVSVPIPPSTPNPNVPPQSPSTPVSNIPVPNSNFDANKIPVGSVSDAVKTPPANAGRTYYRMGTDIAITINDDALPMSAEGRERLIQMLANLPTDHLRGITSLTIQPGTLSERTVDGNALTVTIDPGSVALNLTGTVMNMAAMAIGERLYSKLSKADQQAFDKAGSPGLSGGRGYGAVYGAWLINSGQSLDVATQNAASSNPSGMLERTWMVMSQFRVPSSYADGNTRLLSYTQTNDNRVQRDLIVERNKNQK